MKKYVLFILLVIVLVISSSQRVEKYSKSIVEDFLNDKLWVSLVEIPFMVDELVEIYRKDSLVIRKYFQKDVYSRTVYTRYCYNVVSDTLVNRLRKRMKGSDSLMIVKMIKDIDYDKNYVKPKIDWSNVYKTCFTCPFGEYPPDRFFYIKFSLIYMGEQEIKEMIRYKNGEQWGYVIEAIEGGDLFWLDKNNKLKSIVDNRVVKYIIEKWSNSNIEEVKEMIRSLEEILM